MDEDLQRKFQREESHNLHDPMPMNAEGEVNVEILDQRRKALERTLQQVADEVAQEKQSAKPIKRRLFLKASAVIMGATALATATGTLVPRIIDYLVKRDDEVMGTFGNDLDLEPTFMTLAVLVDLHQRGDISDMEFAEGLFTLRLNEPYFDLKLTEENIKQQPNSEVLINRILTGELLAKILPHFSEFLTTFTAQCLPEIVHDSWEEMKALNPNCWSLTESWNSHGLDHVYYPPGYRTSGTSDRNRSLLIQYFLEHREPRSSPTPPLTHINFFSRLDETAKANIIDIYDSRGGELYGVSEFDSTGNSAEANQELDGFLSSNNADDLIHQSTAGTIEKIVDPHQYREQELNIDNITIMSISFEGTAQAGDIDNLTDLIKRLIPPSSRYIEQFNPQHDPRQQTVDTSQVSSKPVFSAFESDGSGRVTRATMISSDITITLNDWYDNRELTFFIDGQEYPRPPFQFNDRGEFEAVVNQMKEVTANMRSLPDDPSHIIT